MEVVDLREVYCHRCTTLIGCDCHDEIVVRRKSLQKFTKSLESSGFVQIVGHGVDEIALSRSIDEAQHFFNRSRDFKEGCISKDRARRGYSPASTENFASLIGVAGKPNDLVQKYRIGPIVDSNEMTDDPYYNTKEARIHFYPNNQVELQENFSVVSTEYRQHMDRLAKQLIELILFCSNVPTTSFESLLNKHTSILSLNYYESLDISCSNPETIIRVEAHTDVSMLTIVAQSAQHGTAAGALQVLVRGERESDGEFVTVPYIPGALVVNVGDCLHDWSGGRYPSALHRVVNLPITETTLISGDSTESVDSSRYSLAYFFAPNYDAVMKWPDSIHTKSSPDGNTTVSGPLVDYSTWRKNHIKKSMQQLKKNTTHSKPV